LATSPAVAREASPHQVPIAIVEDAIMAWTGVNIFTLAGCPDGDDQRVASAFVKSLEIGWAANETPLRFAASVTTSQPCRVPPSDAPQDTAACCFLPDYARLGTLPISSTLRTPLGFPTPYEKRKGCDLRLQGL
jgi:hypothetical protein